MDEIRGDCMEIVEEKDKDEIVILGKLIAAQRNNETFNRLKERVEKNVLELLAEVQSCTLFDKDALQHALKDVTAAKHTLIALKENKNMEVLESKIKASNANITTQRRFYSTKKKAKERKIRLAKPSIEEKELAFKGGNWLTALGGDVDSNKEEVDIRKGRDDAKIENEEHSLIQKAPKKFQLKKGEHT